MKYLLSLLFLCIAFNSWAQHAHCELKGAVFVETSPTYADYIVFVESSEAFSDLLIFESDNQLFADRPGIWFFSDNRNFADFTVFFTDNIGMADFTVYYTKTESFAGCNH